MKSIFEYILIALALVVIAAVAEETLDIRKDPNWQAFKSLYRKKYSSQEEEKRRYAIFLENTKKASEILEADPFASYGMSEKSDVAMKDLIGHIDVPAERSGVVTVEDDSALPLFYDGRSHGIMNGVRDQGTTGASWAFATTALVEAGYKVAHGTLPSLSDQQLIDCAEGGWYENSLKYLQDNGQMKRSEYSFKGKKVECKFDKDKVHAKVLTYMNIASTQEDIMKAVLKYGAVATVVDATKFNTYRGGIMGGELCEKKNPNLAVVIVGWGTKDDNEVSTPFWLVRNSWGTKWGESGYFRIIRGFNACGIEQHPMVLTVA